MSYLYDSLKNALGGKNFKSGTVIKDWSPNEVRAIYIMRNFILIADFIRQPKIYRLNPNEVSFDLTNRNRRGNLNNLLVNRQLSCMEEIYVDSCYIQYKDVIDLDAYVRGMYNQSSRLRYYGYVRGFDESTLQNLYSQALINGSMDFTVAQSMGNFEYQDVGNKDWYKKYNLRPQYYTIDGPKGKLHTYFSKCEDVVGTKLQEKDRQIALLETSTKIVDMFKVDMGRLYDIKLLMEFVKFSKNFDDFTKLVSDSLQKNMSKSSLTVEGLTKEMFLQAMQLSKTPKNNDVKDLMGLYQKVSAFSTKEGNFNPTDTDISDGIYQLEKRVDTALAEVLNAHTNNKEYCLMYLLTCKASTGLPEGKLTEALDKKGILVCQVKPKGNIDGLLNFAYSLCGFRKEDFESHLKKG